MTIALRAGSYVLSPFPHKGVGFWLPFLLRSRLLLAFPLGEGGPHQRRSGALVNGALETISLLSFIPLEPYPARSARHLPHAGKALSVGIVFPTYPVFALTIWG